VGVGGCVLHIEKLPGSRAEIFDSAIVPFVILTSLKHE